MEMACEVCPAQPLSANIGLEMFGGGRHPRQLRLQIDFDGRLTLYEMFAPRRFAIERGYLESYVPDNRAIVPDSEVAGFELWLGSRYRRRALPNAFDLRLGKGHTKIRKALVPVHEHVQQLLYSIQPLSELNDPDRVYELKIVILARSSSWQNLETVSALEEAKSRIEEILDECNGIQAEVELASDSKFTYDKLHTYSQWGFEDLSAD
jgi:hypothetical protein